MKRLKWAIGLLLLAAVPTLAWAGVANAQRFSATVDKDQTVNSSLYSAGKIIDINGTINGDVFCAGQTITIDADVRGDIICAGQDVTISGKVDGDIRVAGQLVAIDADVSRSITVAAMTFSLDAGAKVGRDLTATGDNLNIKGAVGRDVVAGGSVMTLNGKVGRNVRANGANLKLRNDAAIAGNLVYTSDNKADIASGASIAGETTRTAREASQNTGPSFDVGFYLFALAGLLLIGLSLAYFFPQFMHQTSGHIKSSFGKALLVGVLASVTAPLITLLLLVTIVGIPLSLLLLLGLFLGGALSGPIAGYYVGRLVLRNQKSPLLIMLVGGAITITACFLPWIGFLVVIFAYWLGFGALLLALKQHLKPGFKPAK
jgi:cytoskeletal protein CcmA (bactofilin family)